MSAETPLNETRHERPGAWRAPGIKRAASFADASPDAGEYVGQEHLVGDPVDCSAARSNSDTVRSLHPLGAARHRQDDAGAHHRRRHRAPLRPSRAPSRRASPTCGGWSPRRKRDEQADGSRTVLFIDEIHRFNKAQQDAILPYVEDGTVILIGATTENPSFEVNAPLLSRARVFVLTPLPMTTSARSSGARWRTRSAAWGRQPMLLTDGARLLRQSRERRCAHRAQRAWSRRRSPPTALATERPSTVTDETVMEAAQRRAAVYDRAATRITTRSRHCISRCAIPIPTRPSTGSGGCSNRGEDPLFIARRLVRAASEDIGLADPQALVAGDGRAAGGALHRHARGRRWRWRKRPSTSRSRRRVTPSIAPTRTAMKDVAETRNDPVPLHLRNAPPD